MTYTVKKLADLAGVSVRTLHYYDEIGLLSPDGHSPSGYRQYGDGASPADYVLPGAGVRA